jgi:DNA-binding NarL/FixJ family response regulator
VAADAAGSNPVSVAPGAAQPIFQPMANHPSPGEPPSRETASRSDEATGDGATPPIRVLIADDHPVVRDGLALILQTEPDFQVVGLAADGREALWLAEELRPAVLLLDLGMPELDGVEVIRRLRESRPEIGVVVFTVFDTDERILAALQAGARGYLLKGAPREDVFTALRTVAAGGSLLPPLVASRLLRHVRGEDEAPFEPLSPRQQQVLGLLAQGLQNKEIAAALGVAQRTAKFHVETVLRKLGAGNRTEAVAIATRRHLI